MKVCARSARESFSVPLCLCASVVSMGLETYDCLRTEG